jgi:hypothetical protein
MATRKNSGKPPGQEKKLPVDSSSVSTSPPPVLLPSSESGGVPVIQPDFQAVTYPEPPNEKVHYDEIDVPFALARITQDGKGDELPGPSDFVGYASPDAVKEAGT